VTCDGCPESTSLELGLSGVFAGARFELIGAMHVVSRAGGHWHEWRARLADGGEAWLAEACGAYYWLREGALRNLQDLEPGAPFARGWVVTERGEATRVRTWGDVEACAGQTYGYADLSAPGALAASLDYGESPPRTFTGRRVTLAELGLSPRPGPRAFLAVRGAAFDSFVAPGACVELGGMSFVVLGALARSACEGDERMQWQEALLFHPDAGARWLIVADGRFHVGTPIEAGDACEEGIAARWGDRAFRRLSEGEVRVDAAVGEFPWEVSVGQTAVATDWEHPPWLLGRERTLDEVGWTVVEYLEPEAARRALGLSALPSRRQRAPNRPRRKANRS
jgi:hypothetical protein